MFSEIAFNIDVEDKVSKSTGLLKGLSKEDINFSVIRYIQFMYLSKKYPGKYLAPTEEIDEMWHIHMLSPLQYHKDCIHNFDEILDHNGGFGKKQEEYETWQCYFRDTEKLWEKEFNEKYIPLNPSPALQPMFKAASCHSNGVCVPRSKSAQS